MTGFSGRKAPRPDEGDVLAAHRDRIVYPLAIVGVLFLAPFSINNFWHGRDGLGAAILVIVVSLGVEALAIQQKRRPPIPYALLLLPIVTGIAISLREQGVIGAFWCFPTVLFFFFVLSPVMANLCSLVLLTVATGMVYHYLGMEVTVRFSVTLVLSILIINIILNTIRDLQRKLVEQAITDPLTGAFNRRYMTTRLGDAIERNRRQGAPASVLLIDIDFFKRINDQFGHEVGDRVLKGIVAVIGRRSRKVDLLFRLGGEEFLLLLPDTRETDAGTVAEQLRETIAETPLLDNWPVSVSIGVSELQPDDSLDGWIKGADDAMYEAKRTGRNRVVLRRFISPMEVGIELG